MSYKTTNILSAIYFSLKPLRILLGYYFNICLTKIQDKYSSKSIHKITETIKSDYVSEMNFTEHRIV